MTERASIGVICAGGGGIGLGHLARMTAVAESLSSMGADTCIFTNDEGIRWLGKRGLATREWDPFSGSLPVTGFDAWIVDLPSRPGRWDETRVSLATSIRSAGRVCVLFEDRPGAVPASAHCVVNPNLGAYAPGDLDAPVYLAGPAYQPVRKEFARKRPPVPRDEIGRVFLCLGGNGTEEHERIIDAVCGALPKDSSLAVAPPMQGTFATDSRIEWIGDSNMASAAAGCDLAVVGGGQLKSEMAALGIPAIVVPVADDQVPSCRAWEDAGCAVAWNAEDIALELSSLAGPAARKSLAERMHGIIDGQGAARVAERVLGMLEDKGGAV